MQQNLSVFILVQFFLIIITGLNSESVLQTENNFNF